VARLLLFFLFFQAEQWIVQAQEMSRQDTLQKHANLEEITVSSFQPGTILSSSSSLKTEVITQTGLKKMACCNLSESFENSASVSVGYTDAISGARQIQLLGLSGIYVQTLAENIPTMRGLSSTYGLNYIPASWLQSIQISKGASSVVNGYESITGQMNLEFKKPNNTEPLFLNLHANNNKHYDGNLTSSLQLNEKLWTGLFLSGTWSTDVHDKNRDGFLDMPKIKYINAYNRWIYIDDNKGIQSRTGIKFLYEHRIAGQDSLCHVQHGISLKGVELFKTFITNKNITADNKTGISIGDKEGQSLGIINSFTHHEQNSIFGRKSYNGIQNTYYANVLFSSYFKTTNHRYTIGGSFNYDNYETEYDDNYVLPGSTSPTTPHTPLTSIDRSEAVTGVFGEYTYSHPSGFTAVAGLRTDYNSHFGWLVTPRFCVKYDINKSIILRLSAGRGFHSPNVLSENIGLMASSRNFDISNIKNLDLEKAWNFGGNITFNIPLWNKQTARLSFDYFHTGFQNQIVIDTERNRNTVYFYNLSQGKAYANAWQADLTATLCRGVDLYAAFRYNNNRITYTEGTRQVETDKPLVSAYKGLINLTYATHLRRWVFDATMQVNGPARLPGLNGYDSEKIYSEVYSVYFAQITHNSKRFDIYLGAENIFSYTQKDPIREWQYPFSSDFDASMVWGPLTGIQIYSGIRLRLGKLY
jgi:outer membrane receptor for ferrienterochelin and colicins